MKLSKLLLISLFILIFSSINAQKSIENQNLIWARYFLKIKLNKKSFISQEVDERLFISPLRQSQYLFRTMYQRDIGSGFASSLGLAYFNSSSPSKQALKELDKIYEIRPIIGIHFNQGISDKLLLSHRFLNEWRFFENTIHHPEFKTTRNRYKLEFKMLFSDKVSFNFYDEIFLNIGNNPTSNFDQNRIWVGMNIQPNPKISFELGYLNSYQSTNTINEYYNRNNIRFTLYHNLNLIQ
jgi:hypothetical protein